MDELLKSAWFDFKFNVKKKITFFYCCHVFLCRSHCVKEMLSEVLLMNSFVFLFFLLFRASPPNLVALSCSLFIETFFLSSPRDPSETYALVPWTLISNANITLEVETVDGGKHRGQYSMILWLFWEFFFLLDWKKKIIFFYWERWNEKRKRIFKIKMTYERL